MTDKQTTVQNLDGGRATVARIYDYLLGGQQNFEPDRKAAEQLLQIVPESANMARSNRLFMQRAVRTLAETGIRQFLDLGSGIPTQGNVHEIAQQIAPESRVLYVDIDPVAVVAANALLAGNPTCRAIEADFTHPDLILDALADSDLAGVIDLDQPTVLLYCSVLQTVSDDRIDETVAPIRDRLVAGSAMVISHISAAIADRYSAPTVSRGKDVFRTQAATEITLRTDDQLATLFDDFTVIEPGLVPLSEWRPELGEPDPYVDKPVPSPMRGAVAIRH
ncbi:SAM-dependent methyltransferase [Micromonospora sp. WMMD1082]|uniref:SAM-dependent methyltransferase n=1 Tax=Micromonospora sp. WMMD1082 TaxID=3016104 RepID=UPI002417EE9F|nr:SAM-dependent methyltransferase [Micromonospora sp. WMMD1082]MDG4795979.1 SAM-dependent methyltransferase [Micromonospora sp. WMMD1082]